MCFRCRRRGSDHPCRGVDGSLSVDLLAAGYAVICQEREGAIPDADFWAFECMENIVDTAPDLALACIIATLKLLTSDYQISVLAAGPMEDLMVRHGPRMIAAVERAAVDPAFRHLLSGIWGENRINPGVWRRVQSAVQNGPWLDEDPRTPQGSRLTKDG